MEDKLKLSAEDVAELEKIATEQYEYAQKYPHRKEKYRPMGTQVSCVKCNGVNNLKASELSDGSKIYFCKECIMKEARRLHNSKNVNLFDK